MRAGKYNVAASSHPSPNTVTTEATYFSGMPCWTAAQAMVNGPLVWHGAFCGQWRSSKCPWITVKTRKKDGEACRECPTTARNKGFKKKEK